MERDRSDAEKSSPALPALWRARRLQCRLGSSRPGGTPLPPQRLTLELPFAMTRVAASTPPGLRRFCPTDACW